MLCTRHGGEGESVGLRFGAFFGSSRFLVEWLNTNARYLATTSSQNERQRRKALRSPLTKAFSQTMIDSTTFRDESFFYVENSSQNFGGPVSNRVKFGEKIRDLTAIGSKCRIRPIFRRILLELSIMRKYAVDRTDSE